MTYTLTKVEVDKDRVSSVPTGTSTTLPWLTIFKYRTDEEISFPGIEDIEAGWQIMLKSVTEYHRTSEIKEIISRKKNKVVFKTQTSTYELTFNGGD